MTDVTDAAASEFTGETFEHYEEHTAEILAENGEEEPGRASPSQLVSD